MATNGTTSIDARPRLERGSYERLGGRSMKGLAKEERGAALVTVLLFMVLTFIVTAAMLASTGNEAIISGLHRDGVRATELAQAAAQEAVGRIAAGRPFAQGFSSSLNPGSTVTVTRKFVGTASAYLEIQSTATAGQATRRLSFLVLQQMNQFPPNIVWGPSNASEGEDIRAGDIYSRYWVIFNAPGKPLFNPAGTWTYAGWRISEPVTPNSIAPCYSHASCVAANPTEAANWYPATRLSEHATDPVVGNDIFNQTRKCPAGGGGALDTTTTITGYLASDPCTPGCTSVSPNVYGFDTDGGLAVTAKLPCGLPYKWVSIPFTDETGGVPVTRLFKTIVFEQWFTNYWTFDQAQMTYVKNSSLAANPQFAAIPPNPTTTTDPSNFDRVLTGGGPVTGDLGCKYPEMACSPAVDRPISILLNGGAWTLMGPTLGHGTIVVNGNLAIGGSIQFWGTIIVNGTFDPTGPFITPRDIFGGLLTTTTTAIHHSFHVTAGSAVPSVPTGPSVVVGKAWWER